MAYYPPQGGAVPAQKDEWEVMKTRVEHQKWLLALFVVVLVCIGLFWFVLRDLKPGPNTPESSSPAPTQPSTNPAEPTGGGTGASEDTWAVWGILVGAVSILIVGLAIVRQVIKGYLQDSTTRFIMKLLIFGTAAAFFFSNGRKLDNPWYTLMMISGGLFALALVIYVALWLFGAGAAPELEKAIRHESNFQWRIEQYKLDPKEIDRIRKDWNLYYWFTKPELSAGKETKQEMFDGYYKWNPSSDHLLKIASLRAVTKTMRRMITKKGWEEKLKGLFAFRPTWSPSDFNSKIQGDLLKLKTGGRPFEPPKYDLLDKTKKVVAEVGGVVGNAYSQVPLGMFLSFLLSAYVFGFFQRG